MALHHLSEPEASILINCVCVASESDLFPDWEFQTLFGLTRSEVASVATQGVSADDRNPDVSIAINNAVMNLLGYPHGRLEWVYEAVGANRAEIKRVYEKWKSTSE